MIFFASICGLKSLLSQIKVVIFNNSSSTFMITTTTFVMILCITLFFFIVTWYDTVTLLPDLSKFVDIPSPIAKAGESKEDLEEEWYRSNILGSLCFDAWATSACAQPVPKALVTNPFQNNYNNYKNYGCNTLSNIKYAYFSSTIRGDSFHL